jgi:hypothetical protein
MISAYKSSIVGIGSFGPLSINVGLLVLPPFHISACIEIGITSLAIGCSWTGANLWDDAMLSGGAGVGGDKDAKGLNKRRRNRIPVSCFNCRSLKTKCDGVRPTCSTCAHGGRSCAYLQQGISGAAADSIVVSRQ